MKRLDFRPYSSLQNQGGLFFGLTREGNDLAVETFLREPVEVGDVLLIPSHLRGLNGKAVDFEVPEILSTKESTHPKTKGHTVQKMLLKTIEAE